MTEFFYQKEKIVFKGVFSQNGRFNLIHWLADLFELFTISHVSWSLVEENQIFELKLNLHKRQNGMKSIHVFNSCFSRNTERNLTFWQECACAQFKKKSRYLPHVKLFPLVKTPFTFDVDIPETQQQGIYRNYESHGHQIRFFFLFGNLIYDSHTPIWGSSHWQNQNRDNVVTWSFRSDFSSYYNAVFPSKSRVQISKMISDIWTVPDALRTFKTSRTAHSVTQCHIPNGFAYVLT